MSERRRHLGSSLGNFQKQSFPHFQGVLPSQHQYVTIYMEYCETGKLTHVFVSRAFIEVQLCISELKWTGMGQFNSDYHYIYYCGQESLRRNGVSIIVNKRALSAVLGYNLKNNKMISVHFQDKPFNITVMQPLIPKNLKLNGSMKTYKTFEN